MSKLSLLAVTLALLTAPSALASSTTTQSPAVATCDDSCGLPCDVPCDLPCDLPCAGD